MRMTGRFRFSVVWWWCTVVGGTKVASCSPRGDFCWRNKGLLNTSKINIRYFPPNYFRAMGKTSSQSWTLLLRYDSWGIWGSKYNSDVQTDNLTIQQPREDVRKQPTTVIASNWQRLDAPMFKKFEGYHCINFLSNTTTRNEYSELFHYKYSLRISEQRLQGRGEGGRGAPWLTFRDWG